MATFNIQHSYTRISLDSSITEATSKANGKWEARKTGRKEYVESSPSVIGTFSVSEHSDSSAGCELSSAASLSRQCTEFSDAAAKETPCDSECSENLLCYAVATAGCSISSLCRAALAGAHVAAVHRLCYKVRLSS